MPALRIAAVILFERYEQKDKSGKPDPEGNAQSTKIKSGKSKNYNTRCLVTSNAYSIR
jgi:hypothetical protein